MKLSHLNALILLNLCLNSSVAAQTFLGLCSSKPEKVLIETDTSATYMVIAKKGKGDTLRIEHYLHGKLHGRMLKTRFEFNKTIETHYYKGIKHGLSIERDKKGRILSEVNYFMGKLEGELKTYDDKQQLEKVLLFRNDSLKKKTLYFEEGGIKEVAHFAGDELNGKSYPSKLDGKLIRYFQDGSKRISYFKKGFATGEEYRWNPDGRMNYQSFMLNDSIRKYYYYQDAEKVDSIEIKFWKPFQHPYLDREDVDIFESPHRIVEIKLNYEIGERYHNNGALQRKWKVGELKSYWDNGRIRSLEKGNRYTYNKHFYNKEGKISSREIKKADDQRGFEYVKEIDENGSESTFNFTIRQGHDIQHSYSIGEQLQSESIHARRYHFDFKYKPKKPTKLKKVFIENEWLRYAPMGDTKNALIRFFGKWLQPKIYRKKHYRFNSDDYSLYSGEIKDQTYHINYLNGSCKLKFTLEDSLFSSVNYIGLPNGKPLYSNLPIIEKESPSAEFIQQLAYPFNENDGYAAITSFDLKGDTIHGEIWKNGELIYSFFEDNEVNRIRYKNPKNGKLYLIEKYSNGQLKSIKDSKDSLKRFYYKDGTPSLESCWLETQNNWNISETYHRNGRPEYRSEYNKEDKDAYRSYSFYKSGKLKTLRKGDTIFEYGRDGEQFGYRLRLRPIGQDRVYKSVRGDKTVYFVNGKRQYKSVNYLKQLPRRVYGQSKRKIQQWYLKCKSLVKRLKEKDFQPTIVIDLRKKKK